MTLLSVTAIAADPLRVRGEAEIRVVWSPDAYAFAHTLLTFELVPDADGFLRIRRIVESGTARATPGLEVLTWADIKARFYEGDLP
jgi:hypothetical protein